MSWEVEFTNEFGEWWDELTEEQQDAVDARVELLIDQGPDLGRPSSIRSRGRVTRT